MTAKKEKQTFPRTEVLETDVGKALFACDEILKGQSVYQFTGKLLDAPNMHTVQLEENKHILCHGGPEFTSHSCKPNSYFRFKADCGDDNAAAGFELIALRTIAKGEPISFDYNTTEWDMSCKFKCLCQSDNCYRIVQGYKYLTAEQRAAIKDQVSPFIKLKAEQEQAHKDKADAAESTESKTEGAASKVTVVSSSA